MTAFLPTDISLSAKAAFFGGKPVTFRLTGGLTIFVGPNGSGKTETLRSLRDQLRGLQIPFSRKVVYLSSGRNSSFENYRSSTNGPHHHSQEPAAVGHRNWQSQWGLIEGVPGIFMHLKDRPDLLLKVEARLQSLYQRRLRLEWSQQGLQVGFSPTTGGEPYYANAEASGLLQFIPLLAAVYDNEIGALLVDEPEISLHPQLQTFLLQEMEAFAGDPTDRSRKLVVLATHSPSLLPIRRIADVTKLVFFTDRQSVPIQIQPTAGELKSSKLGALVARLNENHKIAFFARSVLLVEGPSDEIVVGGLSLKLEHPLLGSNTQVVPVTGKGQLSESVKLFRLMGKHVFVLADLDALADDNKLVNVFRDAAQHAANASGMESIMEMDRAIRDTFASLLDRAFAALSPSTLNHQYWTARGQEAKDELKAKRRATLAVLLSLSIDEIDQNTVATELSPLRKRYDALLDALSTAGCTILRSGTIEDYYFQEYPTNLYGKPEAAAMEMEHVLALPLADIQKQYHDVIRAMHVSAPLKKIDENSLLREQLGSLLGAALQIARPGMLDDELNARAAANLSAGAPVFRFANRSIQDNVSGVTRSIEVSITSPLFARQGFPFEISERDNLTALIDQKLPSK